LGDITGSLTPGKRADVILVRTTDLNTAPIANIEATIVQSATPANVNTVIADGRIIKRRRCARARLPGMRRSDPTRRTPVTGGPIQVPASRAFTTGVLSLD
jgi:cytosine/adenosine deaminase-related metal-dependent hydrolase